MALGAWITCASASHILQENGLLVRCSLGSTKVIVNSCTFLIFVSSVPYPRKEVSYISCLSLNGFYNLLQWVNITAVLQGCQRWKRFYFIFLQNFKHTDTKRSKNQDVKCCLQLLEGHKPVIIKKFSSFLLTDDRGREPIYDPLEGVV